MEGRWATSNFNASCYNFDKSLEQYCKHEQCALKRYYLTSKCEEDKKNDERMMRVMRRLLGYNVEDADDEADENKKAVN